MLRNILNVPFAVLRFFCGAFAWIVVFAFYPSAAPGWDEFWAFVWRGE